MDNQEDIAIFWDYGHAKLNNQTSCFQFVDKIRNELQAYGTVKSFKTYLDCSEPTFSGLRGELHASGVSLVNCPRNGSKDDAHAMMMVDMAFHATDHPAPYTIVAITGDLSISYLVSTLRFRRYRVILICPEGIQRYLASVASVHLAWSELHVGNSAQTYSMPPSPKQFLESTLLERLNENRMQGDSQIVNGRKESAFKDMNIPSFQDFTLPAASGDIFGTDFSLNASVTHKGKEKLLSTIDTAEEEVTPRLLPTSGVDFTSRVIGDAGVEYQSQSFSPSGSDSFQLLSIYSEPQAVASKFASSPKSTSSSSSSLSSKSTLPTQQTSTAPTSVQIDDTAKPLAVDIEKPAVSNEPKVPEVLLKAETSSTPSVIPTPMPLVSASQNEISASSSISVSKSPQPVPKVTPNDSLNQSAANTSISAFAESSRSGGATRALSGTTPRAKVVPKEFSTLVNVLRRHRLQSSPRPDRSIIASEVKKENSSVYKNAGVVDFKRYSVKAAQAGIVELGHDHLGKPWISLHAEYYGT